MKRDPRNHRQVAGTVRGRRSAPASRHPSSDYDGGTSRRRK
ncbi:hypothetical protein [Arthrobacter sp. ZGTC412]|nr:hypothetical protein [Arthrobacter sp. ZGTC412]